MSESSVTSAAWLDRWMEEHGISLWGAADLRDLATPVDETGQGFPFAVSWAIPMNPGIMAGLKNGPNQAYADEYTRVNAQINRLAAGLAAEIKARGFRSEPLLASSQTDSVHLKGDFPQKTAATRAGLGWIGLNCQLVTRPFGPWIRLGAVFTDLELPCGPPVEQNSCGRCRRCVEACPAKALTGATWHPETRREELLDARACDDWKKAHYFQYVSGHTCGICTSVCPHGLKFLEKKPE
jgi:epoxyqueuosine reductase